MKTPSRILIYRIGQLGDTLVALPAIWAIRRHYPNAFLGLLSDSHDEAGYVLASKVLPKEGLIDEFFSYEADQRGVPFWKQLKLIPRIRQKRFDTLVYLAPRFRNKRQVVRDILFFRLAGISRVIGHKGITAYQKPIPGKPLPHLEQEAEHLLGRLGRSGIHVPSRGEGCMALLLTETEIKEAQSWLWSRPGLEHSRLLIGMAIGSKYPAKIWPEERYASLGQHLIEKMGAYPIIFGGLEDRESGNRLIKKWGSGANAAGTLNVRQAAAALSFCRLFIGNDTGTMHLAAAVGTQCVAIFSDRYFPGCWYPYGSQHLVLRHHVPCGGCTVYECLENDQACLKLIRVGEVWEACLAALTSTGNVGDTETARPI
jgi:ADP-heptose:LPS heptosyltransferase